MCMRQNCNSQISLILMCIIYYSLGIFDRDNSGTIDVHEFSQLWAYINQWKGVFDRYDKDRSGNIDAGELFTGKIIIPYSRSILWGLNFVYFVP